jgi:hydroxymethylglutaryl-CoA lyase
MRVYIQEVAVRDGFQIEPAFVPTEQKIVLIDALSETGLAKIEITSFVSPKAVPNLRDAEEVVRGIKRRPGVVYTALVPNARGAERAVACAVNEINLVMSASETHNRANVNRTTAESLAGFKDVMQVVAGTGIRVNGSISTAFGCPFEGDVSAERVLAFADAYLNLGMHGVTLADTTGMAHPKQVRELTSAARQRFPDIELTLHFHNTRGMGLANVLAALEAGADRFDASLGGLGGCPFAPGATGNLATEDLVWVLEREGVETGIEVEAVVAIAHWLEEQLERPLPGALSRPGCSLAGV